MLHIAIWLKSAVLVCYHSQTSETTCSEVMSERFDNCTLHWIVALFCYCNYWYSIIQNNDKRMHLNEIWNIIVVFPTNKNPKKELHVKRLENLLWHFILNICYCNKVVSSNICNTHSICAVKLLGKLLIEIHVTIYQFNPVQ